jgi:WD40 repeat protein
MPVALICVLAATSLGAGQPLVPYSRLESGGDVWPLTVTADGKNLLGAAKDGDHVNVVVWDTTARSRRFLVKGGVGVPLVASADRQWAAGEILTNFNLAGGEADAEVVVWDISKGSTTSLFKLSKTAPLLSLPGWPVFPCRALAFSHGSDVFACADGTTRKVHLWRRRAAAEWTVAGTLNAGAGRDVPKPTVMEVKFSRNDKELLTFFPITGPGEAEWVEATERWDVGSGRRLDCGIQPVPVLAWFTGPFSHVLGDKIVCYEAPEGSLEGTVGLDIVSGKRKYGVPAPTEWARLSPDGKTCGYPHCLLMRTGACPVTVGFWDFDDGSRSRTLELPAVGQDDFPVATFTADSRYFVCSAGDGGRTIFVIDADKAKIRSSWAVGAQVRGLFPLDSGEIAAVGVEPKALLLYKVPAP